jgi:hypothetical protein
MFGARRGGCGSRRSRETLPLLCHLRFRDTVTPIVTRRTSSSTSSSVKVSESALDHLGFAHNKSDELRTEVATIFDQYRWWRAYVDHEDTAKLKDIKRLQEALSDLVKTYASLDHGTRIWLGDVRDCPFPGPTFYEIENRGRIGVHDGDVGAEIEQFAKNLIALLEEQITDLLFEVYPRVKQNRAWRARKRLRTQAHPPQALPAVKKRKQPMQARTWLMHRLAEVFQARYGGPSGRYPDRVAQFIQTLLRTNDVPAPSTPEILKLLPRELRVPLKR